MKKLYFIISAFSLMYLNFYAQNQVISIWPGPAPGAISNDSYIEEKVFSDGELQRVSKVTHPEIAIYTPLQPNGAAVLIIPGGGYAHLSMQKEGHKVALWLNSLGVTAFVLKYRLPHNSVMSDKSLGPLQDAQEAIRIIRRNAEKWGINPQKVGVIGFSAGGHLASTLATQYFRKVYKPDDTTSARPDFCILIYPVISMKDDVTHKVSRKNLLGENPAGELVLQFSNEMHVTVATPPTFLVHAADDTSVPTENSLLYFEKLRKNNVPAELHIYETGGHGFGLGHSDKDSGWPDACTKWLRHHSFTK